MLHETFRIGEHLYPPHAGEVARAHLKRKKCHVSGSSEVNTTNKAIDLVRKIVVEPS
jgi:hypothetical protein